MSVSKTFKVEVYEPREPENVLWDWSNEKLGTRIFKADYKKNRSANKDTYNYYVYITITRNTAEECYDEFDGQVSDGYFENYIHEDEAGFYDEGKHRLIGNIWEVL